MGSVGRAGVVWGLAMLCWSGAAWGEERAAVRLEYQAEGAGCPEAEEFADLVAARLGYSPFVDESTGVVEVAIGLDEDGGEIVGRLTSREGDGETRTRQIAESPGACPELAEALALALAVAVDPLSIAGPRPPAEARPEPAEPPPPEVEPVEPAAPPAPPPPPGVDLGLSVSAAMICSVGLTPDASLGGMARVALTLGRWSVGIEGRAEGRVSGRGEAEEVTVYQGGLSPCVGVSLFSFCAVISAGAFQARAPFVVDPQLQTTAFGAVGARVRAELSLTRHIALAALAELSIPFVRASLEVDDEVLWAAPPVYGTFAVAGVFDFL